MTAASKILAFPRKPGRLPVNSLAAVDRDDRGPNVAEMLEYRHLRPPLAVTRSPELLIALCLLKAMPDDTRREVRQKIAGVCADRPDDEIARVAMSLATAVF